MTEQVVSGSLTGDLGKYGIKLPTADDGMQFNTRRRVASGGCGFPSGRGEPGG